MSINMVKGVVVNINNATTLNILIMNMDMVYGITITVLTSLTLFSQNTVMIKRDNMREKRKNIVTGFALKGNIHRGGMVKSSPIR